MKNELARTIEYTELKSQYDMQCKKVLAQKVILSRILKGTMEEFADMLLEEIEACIEGNPEISAIPVLPGETNAEQITGLTNEDSVVGEGTVYYDIRFNVYIPRIREKQKIIINLEAQKDFYPGYEIVTRGIYYGSRMISAQYGTEFVKSDYDSIKKVCSIWICMNAPKYIGNTITEYYIEKKDLVGQQSVKKSAYDKMSVVIVTLNENVEVEDELTGMLNVLLSEQIRANEKKRRLQQQYSIPIEREIGEEMNIMCNLSDLVEEKGIRKGIKLGIEQGIETGKRQVVAALIKKGKFSDKDIMEAAEISMEQLEELKKEVM